jgi:hypothetical protein
MRIWSNQGRSGLCIVLLGAHRDALQQVFQLMAALSTAFRHPGEHLSLFHVVVEPGQQRPNAQPEIRNHQPAFGVDGFYALRAGGFNRLLERIEFSKRRPAVVVLRLCPALRRPKPAEDCLETRS